MSAFHRVILRGAHAFSSLPPEGKTDLEEFALRADTKVCFLSVARLQPALHVFQPKPPNGVEGLRIPQILDKDSQPSVLPLHGRRTSRFGKLAMPCLTAFSTNGWSTMAE